MKQFPKVLSIKDLFLSEQLYLERMSNLHFLNFVSDPETSLEITQNVYLYNFQDFSHYFIPANVNNNELVRIK